MAIAQKGWRAADKEKAELIGSHLVNAIEYAFSTLGLLCVVSVTEEGGTVEYFDECLHRKSS